MEYTIKSEMQTFEVSCDGADELFVTAATGGREALGQVTARAVDRLRSTGGEVLAQRVFTGSLSPTPDPVLQEADWPVTLLRTDPGVAPDCTQIHAVRGAAVERVFRRGRPVASVYEDGGARWCRMGALGPEEGSTWAEDQAGETFEEIQSVLHEAGMGPRNLVRTWFYLDDILSWYGDFNRVRDSFFARHGVYDGVVPASTGIGMGNAAGASLAAEALALQPTGVEVRAVDSPLQCSAMSYGSSFSRAVEVQGSTHSRLYVSGTASLDGDGRTMCRDNFAGQMERTLEVAAEILRTRGMGWEDVVRAVAYCPMPRDFGAMRRRLEGLGLAVSQVPAVVCRGDLLFEVELDAVRDVRRRSI